MVGTLPVTSLVGTSTLSMGQSADPFAEWTLAGGDGGRAIRGRAVRPFHPPMLLRIHVAHCLENELRQINIELEEQVQGLDIIIIIILRLYGTPYESST